MNFKNYLWFRCESCDKLSAVWKEMAKKFNNVPEVFMAKVDCTDQPQLCRMNRVRNTEIQIFQMINYGSFCLIHHKKELSSLLLQKTSFGIIIEFMSNFVVFFID